MSAVQAVERKRTRAEVLRDKVKIRLAADGAGHMIAAVLKGNGIELPAADWSQLGGNWLIATLDDEVIGCLQVLPGKPVAWCEFLYAKKSAPFKFQAIAIRKLIAAGMATAYHGGAQYVAGMVDSRNAAFRDVLKKLNFVQLNTHTMMAKSLGAH